MFILQGRSYSSSCWFNLGVYSTILLAVQFRDSVNSGPFSYQLRIVQPHLDCVPNATSYREIDV